MGRNMNAIVYLAVLADNERGALPREIKTARVAASESLTVNEALLAAPKVEGTADKSRARK